MVKVQALSNLLYKKKIIDGKKYSPYCDPNKEMASPPMTPSKCKYFLKKVNYINLQAALVQNAKNKEP